MSECRTPAQNLLLHPTAHLRGLSWLCGVWLQNTDQSPKCDLQKEPQRPSPSVVINLRKLRQEVKASLGYTEKLSQGLGEACGIEHGDACLTHSTQLAEAGEAGCRAGMAQVPETMGGSGLCQLPHWVKQKHSSGQVCSNKETVMGWECAAISQSLENKITRRLENWGLSLRGNK